MAFQSYIESKAVENVFPEDILHMCWEQICPLFLSALLQQETEISHSH